MNRSRVFPFCVNIKSPRTATVCTLQIERLAATCVAQLFYKIHFHSTVKIMRLVWIFTIFGTLTGCVCSIVDHPFHLRWLSSAKESRTEKPKLKRTICDTHQCKELAKGLLEGMNPTVDPCVDFYEYACGNWKKHNPLPEGENLWNLPLKIKKNVENRLKVIIEEKPQINDFHSAKLARRAFNACMNTDEMERAGLQPLISTLWRAGGWPLIMEEDEWDDRIYIWQNVDDYYAQLIGKNSLYDVLVDVNYEYVYEMSLYIKTPHILSSMYKILNSDEVDEDIVDEEESKEGSQERGSEERGVHNNPDDQNDNEEEEDDEEGNKLRKRRIATRRRVNSRIMRRRRTNNRVSTTRKHDDERKLKQRTKRYTTITKSKVHSKEQHRGRKMVNKRNDHKHNKKIIKKLSSKSSHKEMSDSDSIKKSTKIKSSGNNKKYRDASDDLYFDYLNEEENNNNSNIDENDKNTDENDNDSDNTEWSDEDANSSGDRDRDDEDGNSSSDYEWDGEDNSDSNDDSNTGEQIDKKRKEAEEKRRKEMEEKKRKEVEEKRKRYAEYILNVSIALSEARGVPIPKERLYKDIADMIKFQIKIAQSVFAYSNGQNMTLKTLQRKYDALKPTTSNGKINWIKKVQDLFGSGGIEFHEDTYYFVTSFDYIKGLRKLLDRTPSRTIVNYVHWNFLSRVIDATTKEMKKLYYDWDGTEISETYGITDCVDKIKARYILGYEYVKRYFSEKMLRTALDMVDDIQKEVEHEIKKSPWLDAQTRDIVLDKIVYMKSVIGYPDSYSNITIVKEHFRGLSVTKSHYENTLSIMRYMKWDNLNTFITNEFPRSFDLDPLLVNAFFAPMLNAIEITAADFQKPFYDSNQPWYTNYGNIGLIMGHEVNHGFDDTGRQFDKEGGPAEWSPDMQEEYDKRLKCFTDQFTRYSVVENRTANIAIEDYGKQTVSENIADTMGLKAVFKAYERRLRECDRPDPMLPGLEDLSNEQLFFLSFANVWCEVYDPVKLLPRIKRDPHSIGALRVIGSISNSNDFAKAYNCPVDSPMNPTEKCSIWK